MTIELKFKEIRLEDVCGSDKHVPPTDAWACLGHGRGGWGRWGLRCRERDREGALLQGVGPLHGVNEDTAVTPTGRRGGRQRGSCMEERRRLCACVHSRGEEGSGSKTRRKAKQREGCHCAGRAAALAPAEASQEEAKAFLLCVCSRAKKKEAEVVGVGVGEEKQERRKES